ncbi:MAG: TonB-dependent receptor [Bacteroidota bacterium]
MRQLIFLQFFLFLVTLGFGQKVVSGKIVEKDGEPLIGAHINITGTEVGTITDFDGLFLLEIPEKYDSITISYTGFLTVSLGLKKDKQTLNIILQEDPALICDGGGVITISHYQPQYSQYKESPAAVFLSPSLLQLDEQTNIAPTLNRVPGVFMHSGALNTNRITVRGIGSRNLFGTAKIRAFLDGIPLTNGSGETTIEDIDLSLVDNVQIVKGPTSSAYGAGLGGVIYLNTDSQNEGNELNISNTFGSYNLQRNLIQYKYGKDNFNLSIGLNRTHSDGYRENNEYDRLGFTVLSKYEKKDKKLTLLFNHIDLKAFIPSSLNEDDFLNEPQKAAFAWGQVKGFEDYTRTLIGVSYQTDIGKKMTNTTSLFSSQYRSYESRPFNILREYSTSLGGRTKFKIPLFNYNQLEFGAEFFDENYDWHTNVTNDGILGNLLSDNAEHRQYLNAFVQTRWYINDVIASAGLNFNATDYDLEDRFPNANDLSGDYSFDPVLSPFLTLHYEPNWLNGNTIFAIASHGFAPPTLEETLTPDGNINPNIQPEQGWNFELGSRGQIDWLTYNFSLYSMQIKDLLVARRTAADQFIGINAGKTVHNGIELALSSRHNLRNSFNLYPFLNYSFSDFIFEKFIDEEKDFSGNELTGTAPHITSMGIRFDAGNQQNFYGNINYQFVDAMPLRDDNSIYSEAYHLVNLKLGYRLDLGKNWQLDFSGGINNIFNEQYASMLLINAGSFGGRAPRYYYPGLPRNFYGGVNMRYRLE